jgi:hypothetical protein
VDVIVCCCTARISGGAPRPRRGPTLAPGFSRICIPCPPAFSPSSPPFAQFMSCCMHCLLLPPPLHFVHYLSLALFFYHCIDRPQLRLFLSLTIVLPPLLARLPPSLSLSVFPARVLTAVLLMRNSSTSARRFVLWPLPLVRLGRAISHSSLLHFRVLQSGDKSGASHFYHARGPGSREL